MAVVIKPHEAFRIQVVLRDTTKKVQFLGSVMQTLKSEGRDDATELMGDEISRIISEQRSLEQQYAQRVKERSLLTGIANKEKSLEVKGKIKEIANALRENTRHLCRVLKDNPNLQDNLLKIERDRQQLVGVLEDLNSDMFSMNYHSFAYRVAEELQLQDLLFKKKQQEKETSANARQLQEDYKKELQEYQNETKEAQLEIQRRRDELAEAKKAQSFQVKYKDKDLNANYGSQFRQYQEAEKELLDQIEELKKKKEMELKVHQRLSSFMEKGRNNMTKEIDEWKQKKESDVRDLVLRINQVSTKKESAKKKLEALTEEIEGEKKRLTEKETEEKEREDRMREEREDNERKYKACTVLAREFLKYKEIMSKLKPKKKKTGGKKKK